MAQPVVDAKIKIRIHWTAKSLKWLLWLVVPTLSLAGVYVAITVVIH